MFCADDVGFPRCRADPDCLAAFKGHGGCYFAHHNHSAQDRSCEKIGVGTGDEAGQVYNFEVHGCVGSPSAKAPSSQCHSSAFEVKRGRMDFGVVKPDWKGGLEASLELEMFLVSGSQRLSSERVVIRLRRDIPMVTDVLVHLAGCSAGGETEINATGSVTAEGNVVLNISQYDPLELEGLRLVVVPILPDRNFKVHWASLPAIATKMVDADLPTFQRCAESFSLQHRYSLCKDAGTWTAQPISLNMSPWVTTLTPAFTVGLATDVENENEKDLWPVPSPQKIKLHYDGVDWPIVRSAKKQACRIFHQNDGTLLLQAEFALMKSADALCDLLSGGCMESDRTSLCRTMKKAARGDMPQLGYGIAPSEYLQLIACYWPFRANDTCMQEGKQDRWRGPKAWRYSPVDQKIRNYLYDEYARHGVALPLETLFSSIRKFASAEPEPLYFENSLRIALEICQANSFTDELKTLWLQHSLRTGI